MLSDEQALVLKKYLGSDPDGYGLAAHVDVGSDNKIVAILNDRTRGKMLPRLSVPAQDALSALVFSDYAGLGPDHKAYIAMIASSGTLVMAAHDPTSKSNRLLPTALMQALEAFFPETTQSGQLLRALKQQPASAIEEMFQQPGLAVTDADISRALRVSASQLKTGIMPEARPDPEVTNGQ